IYGRKASLLENVSTGGERVAMVQVVDLDRPGSPNSEFTCHLNDSSHLEMKQLELGETNGKLYELVTTSTATFDRETQPIYKVIIICNDSGIQAKSSSENFALDIADVNDNAPIFVDRDVFSMFKSTRTGQRHFNPKPPTQFEFSVPENAEPGAFVGMLTAIDLDEGKNAEIQYYLQKESGDNASLPFVVSREGEVQLLHAIDREMQDQYEFRVRAENTDNGSLFSTAKVIIHVTDVNDCAPVFTGSSMLEVSFIHFCAA
ncbi:hypothetical protein Ciccas_012773, partial [Cichlidogyrus casuarinus]